MKTLIVGGAGFIGAATAYLLRSRGHDVTIAGRTPPAPGTPLAAFDYVRIDYTQPEQDTSLLGGFDGLIFSAGNDVRHKPAQSGDEHWQAANAQAIPRFFAAA